MHRISRIIMRNSISPLMVIFLGIIFLAGCFDNSDCESDTGSFLKVRFQSDTGTVTPPINEVTIPDGSLLYDTALSTYFLPVNPFSDTSIYIFQTDTSRENLRVIYDRQQKLIHPECGLEQMFTIDTLFTSWSESVNIIEKELLKTNNLNIEIKL